MKLLVQHRATADIRFSPVAALVGLGFIGHAIAGSPGAGIVLIFPLFFTLVGAVTEARV